MHKAGRADHRINEAPAHQCMTLMLRLCQDLYVAFNWGASYEHYIDAGDELQADTTTIVRPSETRFANSMRFVFIKVLHKLPTITKCLQDIKVEKRDGSAKDTEKANEAACLEERLLNGKTLLELAYLCDIYGVYGHIINACQTVNLFPHECMGQVDEVLAVMEDMATTCADHDMCKSVRERFDKPGLMCYWENFHKAAYQERGTIMGTPVVDTTPQCTGIGANRTRGATRTAAVMDNLSPNDLVSTAAENTSSLVKQLTKDLQANVFHPEDRALIQTTRTVTHLEGLFQVVKDIGPVRASAQLGPEYVAAVTTLAPDLAEMDGKVLRDQFQVLCHALNSKEVEVGMQRWAQEKSSKSHSVSNKLAQMLLSTELALFHNCELMIHAITVASLKFSVEAIVESLVSQYEHRFGPKQSVSEETGDQEIEIYVHGPNVAKCNSVVEAHSTSTLVDP